MKRKKLYLLIFIISIIGCKNPKKEINSCQYQETADSIKQKGLEDYYRTCLWEIEMKYFDQTIDCYNSKIRKNSLFIHKDFVPVLDNYRIVGDSIYSFYFILENIKDSSFNECYAAKQGRPLDAFFIFKKGINNKSIPQKGGGEMVLCQLYFDQEYKIFHFRYLRNKYEAQYKSDPEDFDIYKFMASGGIVNDSILYLFESKLSKEVLEEWEKKKDYYKDSLYPQWHRHRKVVDSIRVVQENKFYSYLRTNKDKLEPCLKEEAIRRGVIK